MKKVRITKAVIARYDGDTYNLHTHQVLELEDAFADSLINGGLAVLVADDSEMDTSAMESKLDLLKVEDDETQEILDDSLLEPRGTQRKHTTYTTLANGDKVISTVQFYDAPTAGNLLGTTSYSYDYEGDKTDTSYDWKG